MTTTNILHGTILVPDTYNNFGSTSQVAENDDYGTAITKLQSQLNVGGNLLYQGIVPTSGGSQTMANSFSGLYLNAGSDIASFSITTKSSPQDGEVCWITTVHDIASLTLSANNGQSFANPITSLNAGQTISFRWYDAYSTWRIVNNYSNNLNYIGKTTSASSLSSAVSLTTSTWTSLINISLTVPGRYLIWGNGIFNVNGSDTLTGDLCQIAVTTSQNSNTGVQQAVNSQIVPFVPTTGDSNLTLSTPTIIADVLSSSTYYLNFYSVYSGGSMLILGALNAMLITTF